MDEQAFENNDEAAVDEDGFEVIDERAEFRPTVEMEVQAKVDANHPDARVDDGSDHMVGKTLAQEERIQARNDELEHISAQAELTEQDGRPGRTRDVVTEQSRKQQEDFQERRAAVDHWADPERDDPREMLTQEQLGEVNSEAMRMSEKLDAWSQAAISRRLAKAVVDGKSMMSAVLSVFEQLQTAPGRVVPIQELLAAARERTPGMDYDEIGHRIESDARLTALLEDAGDDLWLVPALALQRAESSDEDSKSQRYHGPKRTALTCRKCDCEATHQFQSIEEIPDETWSGQSIWECRVCGANRYGPAPDGAQ